LDGYQANQELYDALSDIWFSLHDLADLPAARRIETRMAEIMSSMRLTRMPLPEWVLRRPDE
jgi:hypothetical protein